MLPLSASTTWRGALPTRIWAVSRLVAVSMTPRVLAPLSATYSLDPSGESAMPEGRKAPVGSLGPMLGLHLDESRGDPHSAMAAVCVALPVAGSTLKRVR